jgi:hypothetical protein
MKMPRADASTALWVRVVLYLIARLTRNKTTRHLVPVIQPALDALDVAGAGMERADRALIGARAGHDGADDELDEAVTGFEGELYVSVGKNREAGLYKKCFADGLVAVTGAKVSDEVRLVKTLEATIARELRDAEFAARLLPRITAAREEMERQIPLLQQTLDAAATAWSVELAARQDIRRQYRIVFAELVKLFPENMKKVNSFFRDPGSVRRGAVADEGEADESPVVATPGPGTPPSPA